MARAQTKVGPHFGGNGSAWRRSSGGWRLRWIGYAVTVGASPLAHWIIVIRNPRLFGLRAKCCGLLGLVRLRSYRSYRMLCLMLASAGIALQEFSRIVDLTDMRLRGLPEGFQMLPGMTLTAEMKAR